MTIAALSERIKKAEDAMIVALERAYPIGSTVSFYIMHGQVTPSRGEVIGYSGGRYAYLRVRIASRTNPARDIPAADVRVLARAPTTARPK